MFRVEQSPAHMPGCTVRNATVGPVVNLGVLPKGGCAYLNRNELWEATRLMPDVATGIAEQLGWASPDVLKEWADRVVVLEIELEAARSGQMQVVSLDEARALFTAPAAA